MAFRFKLCAFHYLMNVNARKLSEIRKVLLDPSTSGPRWTYLMIRNLPFLSRENIRCDLTILHSCRLGQEFNKTFGHIHRPEEPETYKVIFGKAVFLIQKMTPCHFGASSAGEKRPYPPESDSLQSKESDSFPSGAGEPQSYRGRSAEHQSDKAIEEIKLIPVSAGEKITIPPGWHHETINLSRTPLILLNWIKKGTGNDYTLIEKKKGFGYYVVAGDDGEYELVKNENYKGVPEIKIEELKM